MGVTEAVLSAGINRKPVRAANYSRGRLASSGLAGAKLFSTRQDAQPALPVGTDRTME